MVITFASNLGWFWDTLSGSPNWHSGSPREAQRDYRFRQRHDAGGTTCNNPDHRERRRNAFAKGEAV